MFHARSDFFNRTLSGLRSPITKAQAEAVEQAVEAMPEDAPVTRRAFEDMGLEEGVEAALVFKLLQRHQPITVSKHLRSASDLSQVFDLILTDGHGGFEHHGKAGGRAKDFWQSLDLENPELVNTGAALTDSNLTGLTVGHVDPDGQRVELDVTFEHSNQDGRLIALRDGKDWAFFWSHDEEDNQRPLSELDIGSLTALSERLVEKSAAGAEDPLLASLREELEASEDKTFSDLSAAAMKILQSKKKARAEALEVVNQALKKHLDQFAVGAADKNDLDDLIDGLRR